MNEEENNFDALRQLLKLKRHEVPPPGYFNNFSSQVIARIRAGETAGKQATAGENAPLWFSKFLELFEFKPAFAGAFASAVCLLLFFGIVYADRPDGGMQPFLQNSAPSMATFATATPGMLPAATYAAGMITSNNPTSSLQPNASFFGSGNLPVQPVSFSPLGQ